MVHKKYIKRNGKVYGPYLYENKRVNGKVVVGASIGLAIGLFLAIALVPFVHAQSGSTTATITDDTYIDRVFGAQSLYGDMPGMFAGLITRALLKFNISSIPEGATGVTAVLELYTTASGVEDPHVVTAYLLENTTWNEHDPPRYVAPWFDCDVLDSQYVKNVETWYEWNVTDGVVECLSNSSDVVSFILCYPYTSGTDMPNVIFTSKEGSITKMPKLTVFWESIIPDLPSNMLTLFIIISLSAGALVFRKKILKNQN